MLWNWSNKSKNNKEYREKQHQKIEKIAERVYQNRLLNKKTGNKKSDWDIAKKIAKSPSRKVLFSCHSSLIKLEKNIWEPLLAWANDQALLDLLGLAGNTGIIIAVVMFSGSEKQRRDIEIGNNWQTITNADGQTGSGGRIQALEFLNASPRDRDYQYSGANWRRRSICLWLCTWPSESLDGINLSVKSVNLSPSEEQILPLDKTDSSEPLRRVYLEGIQLPKASLKDANLESADLRNANLKNTNLRNANLKNTNLSNANLKNTNLEATYLVSAFLEYANLENAFLEYANLENAFLEQANLEKADLEYGNLKNANLWLANLKGTDLEYTSLESADLRNTNLEAASLRDANLKNANLRDANLKDADLRDANLEGADLWGANLKGADLRDANLEGTNLSGTTLDKMKNLTQEQLTQAKFCQTQLPHEIPLDSNRDCKELALRAT